MDYLSHFQLQKEPFSNAPDDEFYFKSSQHEEAMKRMLFCSHRMKGLSVLLGEIGSGKTTLARRILDLLPESEFEAYMIVIIHGDMDAQWLIERIAAQLGIEQFPNEKPALFGMVFERLLQIQESGKKTVFLIDEAQMLNTKEVMEEMRGLLNLEVPGQKLITFLLFGLPELEESLKLDPPLYQRIGVKCRLGSFELDGTKTYIRHRLAMAGRIEPLFSEDALNRVHEITHGLPRLINTLCDNVLFECYMANEYEITQDMVLSAGKDLDLWRPAETQALAELDATKLPEPKLVSLSDELEQPAISQPSTLIKPSSHQEPERTTPPPLSQLASRSAEPQKKEIQEILLTTKKPLSASNNVTPRKRGSVAAELEEIDQLLENLMKM